MKNFINIFKIILLFVFIPVVSKACIYDFNVLDAKGKKIEKDIQHKNGDVIVLEVTWKQKHRGCDVDISETKFNVDGFKIISNPKWETIDRDSYSKKLKLKVIDNKKSTSSIIFTRNCDRGIQTKSFIINKNK